MTVNEDGSMKLNLKVSYEATYLVEEGDVKKCGLVLEQAKKIVSGVLLKEDSDIGAHVSTEQVSELAKLETTKEVVEFIVLAGMRLHLEESFMEGDESLINMRNLVVEKE